MSQPWFKCYPRDFNDGMVGLTLEERGAYVTILNVIYARSGPIDDDPFYMRALLCCSPKTWTKIRASLIVKRKLFAVNYNGIDCLMNQRAADEIADREEKTQKFSDGGARGGRKTQAKIKKNKDLGQATLEPGLSDTDTDTEAERISEPKGSSSSKAREADFERFWSAYPKRVGKDAARKKYAAALGKISGPDPPGVLLEALERVKLTWTDPQYIPHPTTWLNQGRWEDEPEPPRQALQSTQAKPNEPNRPDAKRAAREANYARAFAAPVLASGGSWD